MRTWYRSKELGAGKRERMKGAGEKNSTAASSRHLAVLCLTWWDRERQAIQPHIETVLYGSALAANDRQLAVMLVQGVLRQLQYLDAVIGRFSKVPLAKMKPLTRMALRVGVYQLIFLDRIPDSAAVNETVKVLKKERQPPWIINFVNGVLRTVVRSRESLPPPDGKDEKGNPFLNHPEWLVRRWQAQYGSETTGRICRVNNREPVLVIRTNTLKTTSAELARLLTDSGCEVQPGQYAPHSLVLHSLPGPVAALPGYEEGLFHVQDEAAQLAGMLLAPFETGARCLDACAGLGGKTCHLAQLLPLDTELVAVEPSRNRFRVLEQNLMRLELDRRVEVFNGGLADFAQAEPGRFHRILVDAPCSGTGVIGRHPDIRWNRRQEDLPGYQQLQLALLDLAASLLMPGGLLVYVTCSMEPEENQQVVEKCLEGHADILRTDSRKFLPPPAAQMVDREGYFSPTPADGLDGFFAARLVRKQ